MSRLPSLFVSHGAPTFALEPGLAGPRLTALGSALPRPEAVLVVSPHWTTPSPRVGRPGAAGCQAVAWVERQPGELPAAGPAGATAG